MAYEVGNVPDLRSERRKRRFSWKALVVVAIALGVFAIPIMSMLGWLGTP